MSAQPPAAGPETRAKKIHWLTPLFYVLLVLIIFAGLLALYWVSTLPNHLGEQQTIVVGATQFSPDSDASLRVIVQDFSAGTPISGANVQVSLKPAQGRTVRLYEGQTDATGSLPVSFHVPADAGGMADEPATLIVETSSSAGRDRVEQSVVIQRDYRLLLSTDKPLYQPGQTIHMRVLAISLADYRAVPATNVDFLVEDAKGNKVFRQTVPTSDFGLAAADFTLATMVNQGSYKLSVAIGETRSEKTVEVRPYVLPKFAVTVTTDRAFYLPGQHVEGTIQADYFFGKPVAGGQVQIAGTVWEVERTVVLDLRGQTDENGAFPFSFDLPTYFAGSGLESGQAQFALEVTVIDQAEHAEQTSQVLPVSDQPMVIEAVPESGVLKPGVENIVYILTSYPDGRPASSHLTISANGVAVGQVDSGDMGLAQFPFTPTAGVPTLLFVTAADSTGLAAQRQFQFDTEYNYNNDNILLRADRAAYLVGETMQLTALSAVDAGDVYLDIVKAGQTLSTRSAPVVDGRADFAIDVSAELYGTIELHAYKVLLDGTIVRDTRLVVVDAPTGLPITVAADKETYLPGETATIDLNTGSQAALGLAIVDESVFALQQQDPGFAKLYFLLEQDLLQPRYQIKAFEPPSTLPADQTVLRQAQDAAAKASWAGVQGVSFSPLNSRQLKMDAAYAAQQHGYKLLGTTSTVMLILCPVGMLVAVVADTRRAKITGRAIGRALTVLGIVFLVFVLAAITLGLLDVYPYELDWLFALLGLAALLALLVFLVYAAAKGSTTARVVALLTLLWGTAIFLFFHSAEQVGVSSERLLIAALLVTLLLPLAYLLLGQGSYLQQRRLAGVTTTAAGALFFPAVLLVLSVMTTSMSFGRAGGFANGEVMLEGAFRRDLALQPPMMAMGAMPAPTAAPTAEDAAGAWESKGQEQQQGNAQPPRLRQYFPETLYWAPEVLTDESGHASLAVPMADTITTWRLTALASTQDGRLGFTTQGLRVFQDFFVDIDLPIALTVGDEVHIPVGVYNYLQEPQQVRLVAQPEEWFEFIGSGEQTMTIAANDVSVVYFPIRVKSFGRQGFQVTAWGSQMNDAIRREVTVLPNGKEFRLSDSDWLRESRTVTATVPLEAIPGTAAIEVKIYPGVLSQVVEGLEKILQLPYG